MKTSVTRPLSREKLSSHCREMTSEFCAVSNRNCVPTRRRDRSLAVVSESREKFPRKYSLPPIATAAGELKGWFLTQGATPAALPKRRPGSRYRVRPSQDAVRLVETLDMTDTKLLRTHCLCRRFHVGLLARKFENFQARQSLICQYQVGLSLSKTTLDIDGSKQSPKVTIRQTRRRDTASLARQADWP